VIDLHDAESADGGPDGLVGLQGARNFRDLGGCPTADGRQLRWGRVFRSGHLAALTPADHQVLGALGVQTVVDFRGPLERAEAPPAVALPASIEVVLLPVGDGSVERRELIERIRSGQLAQLTSEDMVAFYLLTLDAHADVFGGVLARVADPDSHALVFHCTAGKDRTGLVAALLLTALGVPEPVVLDDYELTNRFRAARRVGELRPELEELGIDIDELLPFFTAPRAVLAGTLEGVRQRYGSVEAYLLEEAEVSSGVLDALRRELLAPPDAEPT